MIVRAVSVVCGVMTRTDAMKVVSELAISLIFMQVFIAGVQVWTLR